MQTINIEPQNAKHAVWISDIWNEACGETLAISPRFAEFNLRPTTGALQTGIFVLAHGVPVGFVISSVTLDKQAWIDCLAVRPRCQKQGAGTQLLQHAENWLRAHGAGLVQLGGSLRPFTPGLPTELHTENFFTRRGFAGGADDLETDVACDLSIHLKLPQPAKDVDVRPAGEDDVDALCEFLQRAFAGRWHFEFEEFVREGGRMSDYMVLWSAMSGVRRIEAFCQTTQTHSLRPLDRFYPHPLPKPWGQAGPVGVSEACRGKGYAAAVLGGALQRLREQGVRGCIIDWTDLLAFYAKFGFHPHRQYKILSKTLDVMGHKLF